MSQQALTSPVDALTVKAFNANEDDDNTPEGTTVQDRGFTPKP